MPGATGCWQPVPSVNALPGLMQPKSAMGCRQEARHGILVPASGGSNPPTPA